MSLNLPRLPGPHRLSGHEDYVNSLSWSPDGKKLASGGDDKLIRLWDAATGKVIRRLIGHDARIWPAASRIA